MLATFDGNRPVEARAAAGTDRKCAQQRATEDEEMPAHQIIPGMIIEFGKTERQVGANDVPATAIEFPRQPAESMAEHSDEARALGREGAKNRDRSGRDDSAAGQRA